MLLKLISKNNKLLFFKKNLLFFSVFIPLIIVSDIVINKYIKRSYNRKLYLTILYGNIFCFLIIYQVKQILKYK